MRAIGWWLVLGVACGGEPVDETPAGENLLLLSFRIDDALVERLDEEDSLTGPFRGSVYAADDTTDLGPIEGAEALASIDVESVTLAPDGSATAALWTSEPLEAGWVRVLGFLDSDGNADPDAPDPDKGDPVTLPSQNEFQIVDGEDTEGTVYFGLLRP